MEDDPANLAFVHVGCRDQVPGNGFASRSWVGGEVDFLRTRDILFQFFDDIALVVHHTILRFKVILDIY